MSDTAKPWTPAPWNYRRREATDLHFNGIDAFEIYKEMHMLAVRELPVSGAETGREEADVRLQTAAPDLADALIQLRKQYGEMLSQTGRYSEDEIEMELETATAALSKAGYKT